MICPRLCNRYNDFLACPPPSLSAACCRFVFFCARLERRLDNEGFPECGGLAVRRVGRPSRNGEHYFFPGTSRLDAKHLDSAEGTSTHSPLSHVRRRAATGVAQVGQLLYEPLYFCLWAAESSTEDLSNTSHCIVGIPSNHRILQQYFNRPVNILRSIYIGE